MAKPSELSKILKEFEEPEAYTIRDPEIERLLRELAEKIAFKMPEGWGFNLLLFEYGKGGNLFYISSAVRSDVIGVMKEFIKRNEH